ncbi:hypothetical protein [Lentzea flaviverrucosa]|uniref:Uncharacterized protein n=1 Tax=Lentzea flaviverrucosa TaxID=200379 RepID=A0A1H9UZF0_9PSEU|nr:hypothetical protein [Lentzea flaviverrucosa]RDI27640.1 hypothetical protein DFR72_106124 [Lentzea flaviverrucosa]SES14786.1 hypothetical protein SAMN05216195_109221 [Lentzea flaviverrucosa]
MSAHIDLKDVRITGHVTQGLIVLVAVASVLGTAVDLSTGEVRWDAIASLLLLPAAVAFVIWVRRASVNATAIGLRDARQMADVWRASDVAQHDRPFEERVPSPWIKPWQYAFLAMMLANAAEGLVDEGPAYRAAAVLSAVLTVVAAALAVVVIAQVSALQRPERIAQL